MTRKVIVYGESEEGGITPWTRELLGIGGTVAGELAAELTVVLINASPQSAAEAICHGADRVLTVTAPVPAEYEPERYLPVMEEVCRKIGPDAVLFPHHPHCADLACRLAFRLGTVSLSDCVELSVEPESRRLLATRPIFGGSIRGTYACDDTVQIVTVREKAFPPAARDSARQGEVVPLACGAELPPPKTRYLRRVVEEYPGKRLQDAEIIVSGGRGMECRENFAQLAELAELLDAAVGGSRPTVEKGWIEPRSQVGLTGVKVSPKLYIAVGISGAVQHLAGALGAKTIVAINKDAGANIFQEAHYGVVGDFKEVLPAFTQRLRVLLGK